MFQTHHELRKHTESLQISVENTAVVLRGELPSRWLKEQLIPVIRQAGVLCQVCDRVRVAA